MDVQDEIAIIYCGVNGLLSNVPLDKVAEFEQSLLQILHAKHQSDVLDVLGAGSLSDETVAILTQVAKEVAGRYI